MIQPPDPGPPFSLVALDTVDSTNDEAKRLARQGFGHGTTIWALEQTAGRGRRGRSWISPRGNLHVSFLIDAGRPLSQAAQLGFVTAVALCDALAELVPSAHFECKWPNDVWCNGRKIAGILLETSGVGEMIVLGVGVDVVAAPEPALYAATSLRAVGSNVDARTVLAAFCRRLEPWLARWPLEGFEPVQAAWLERARGVGQAIEVRLDDQTLTGSFVGLDADGALLLEERGGTRRRVLAGDVFFPAV